MTAVERWTHRQGPYRDVRALDASLDERWSSRALFLGAMVTLMRTWVAISNPLTDTEAYYAFWARFPQLSYYDHPPLTAWFVWLTTRFGVTDFTARIAALACSTATLVLLYQLARRLFSPRAGFIAVAIASSLPALLMVGFLVNPETSLAPFALATLLCVDVMRTRREFWWPWLTALLLGIAFLAKYTAVLLIPVMLIQLVTQPSLRGWLRRPSFYLAPLISLAVVSPVLWWNASRGWPSLTLHLVERTTRPTLGAWFHHAGGSVLAQLALFHFLALPGLLVLGALSLRLVRTDLRQRFLAPAWLFLGVTLFGLVTYVQDSEPHWTMTAYLMLSIAVAGWLDDSGAGARAFTFRPFRIYLAICAAITIVAALIYEVHSQTTAVISLVPAGVYPARADPIAETRGYPELAKDLRTRAASMGPNTVVVSHHNVLCGHLAFALQGNPEVYCVSPRRTEFDFLGLRDPPPEAPVLYVDSLRYPSPASVVLPDRDCDVPTTVDVQRAGRSMNTFRIHPCAAR